tara:strand:+ start:298 stop:915 length:618 start_codon:yes stop_codon:yes gene_type:complete
MQSTSNKREVGAVFFPFFYNDFKADTNHLTNEEKWIYMSLLIRMYREGGFVKDLDRLSLTESISVNDYLKVIDKMEVQYSDDKGYHQKRTTQVLMDLRLHQEKSSKGGVKSSEVRRANSDKSQDDFKRFWSNYPRNEKKVLAEKSWMKQNPDIDVVLKSLSLFKVSDEWKKDNGKYIPHPSTWLNQRRWEDDVKPNRKSSYDNLK